MNILIIGKGGREHAIAWKAAQSNMVSKVFVAPGNDGMSKTEKVEIVHIAENDHNGLIQFAKEKDIKLTIIGPENALLGGLADDFRKQELMVFGPSKKAAMLEGSKQFAKEMMQKYHIQTADFRIFSTYETASAYLQGKNFPVVVKYDGLAAGKGVVVAQTYEEADLALKEMLVERKFGQEKVILEEYLEGPEFSLMTLVNGETVIPLMIAQDHKRAFDGDLGPNTGGMGAYTPVPFIPKECIEEAVENIMKPMAKAMVNEGKPFTGVLYGGLILTKNGVKVIEFNARFGDPETEVVLPKMKSDLIQHIIDLLEGKEVNITWHEELFLGVVMASKGYPVADTKGAPIYGLDSVKNTVFHMGTCYKNGQWLTNGGRVLFVVGKGDNIITAQQDAYQAINRIESDSLFFRTDIGFQML
jgi:phosphoribosylamine--glycine ligase